jgi:hypothetical protein
MNWVESVRGKWDRYVRVHRKTPNCFAVAFDAILSGNLPEEMYGFPGPRVVEIATILKRSIHIHGEPITVAQYNAWFLRWMYGNQRDEIQKSIALQVTQQFTEKPGTVALLFNEHVQNYTFSTHITAVTTYDSREGLFWDSQNPALPDIWNESQIFDRTVQCLKDGVLFTVGWEPTIPIPITQ